MPMYVPHSHTAYTAMRGVGPTVITSHFLKAQHYLFSGLRVKALEPECLLWNPISAP